MALYMNGQEISQSSGVPIAVEGLTEIDSTGTAADILDGKIVYGYDSTRKKAKKLTGTMANNGAVAASIDGLTTMSYTIPAGYHNGSGKVTLTDDIENAKTAIATAIEGKGVTVPDGTLLDGMAALIEAIQAGGDVAPFTSVVCGTFVAKYTKTLTIDGISNCKIFAMRSVEDQYYQEINHIILSVLVDTEASASSAGAVKCASAFYSDKSMSVNYLNNSPTISGDTLTFDVNLIGTYEYIMAL